MASTVGLLSELVAFAAEVRVRGIDQRDEALTEVAADLFAIVALHALDLLDEEAA
jgi:hypothetical protein